MMNLNHIKIGRMWKVWKPLELHWWACVSVGVRNWSWGMYPLEETPFKAAKLISSDTCFIQSKAKHSYAKDKWLYQTAFFKDIQMTKTKAIEKTFHFIHCQIDGTKVPGISLIYHHKKLREKRYSRRKKKKKNNNNWWSIFNHFQHRRVQSCTIIVAFMTAAITI